MDGRTVEVRGAPQHVVVWAGGQELARQQLATVPQAERLTSPDAIARPMTQYTALVAALAGGR